MWIQRAFLAFGDLSVKALQTMDLKRTIGLLFNAASFFPFWLGNPRHNQTATYSAAQKAGPFSEQMEFFMQLALELAGGELQLARGGWISISIWCFFPAWLQSILRFYQQPRLKRKEKVYLFKVKVTNMKVVVSSILARLELQIHSWQQANTQNRDVQITPSTLSADPSQSLQ